MNMSEEKMKVIKNSTDAYKRLPKDKQMFVLGFMQGVLSNHQEKPDKELQSTSIEQEQIHRIV